MVDRDVVLAKVAAVDRSLGRIAEVRARGSQLTPADVEDIVVVNLQRAAQAAIDLAAHVVTTEQLGLPDSLAAPFTLLERAGIVDAELAARMRRMVGFRNIAVHAYESLDPTIVESIVTRHLDDLRVFTAVIVGRFIASDA